MWFHLSSAALPKETLSPDHSVSKKNSVKHSLAFFFFQKNYKHFYIKAADSMHVSKSICKICVIYKTQYVEKLKMVSLGLINHKSNTKGTSGVT